MLRALGPRTPPTAQPAAAATPGTTDAAHRHAAEQAAAWGAVRDLLAQLVQDADAGRRKPPIDRTITIAAPTAAPGTGPAYKLATLDYRYNRLWVANAVNLLVNVLGTPSTIALAPGWNELGLPDGCELTVASGTTNALLRLADWKA